MWIVENLQFEQQPERLQLINTSEYPEMFFTIIVFDDMLIHMSIKSKMLSEKKYGLICLLQSIYLH